MMELETRACYPAQQQCKEKEEYCQPAEMRRPERAAPRLERSQQGKDDRDYQEDEVKHLKPPGPLN